MSGPGDDARKLPERILDQLAEFGDCSARSLAEDLGLDHRLVGIALAKLKRRRRVHIGGWERSEESGLLRPRARWAAGPGADAKPLPRLPRRAYDARYRARQRPVASVFDLGARVIPPDWGGTCKSTR